MTYVVNIGKETHTLSDEARRIMFPGIFLADMRSRIAEVHAWHMSANVVQSAASYAHRIDGPQHLTEKSSMRVVEKMLDSFPNTYWPFFKLIEELYTLPAPRDAESAVHASEIDYLILTLLKKEQALFETRRSLEHIAGVFDTTNEKVRT